jgi:hypothetical protein
VTLSVVKVARTVTPTRRSAVRMVSSVVRAVSSCSGSHTGGGRRSPETLVRQGITSKDSGLVATILAQGEAGMPPSTIGRAHNVHHTTIGRILAAADEFKP